MLSPQLMMPCCEDHIHSASFVPLSVPPSSCVCVLVHRLQETTETFPDGRRFCAWTTSVRTGAPSPLTPRAHPHPSCDYTRVWCVQCVLFRPRHILVCFSSPLKRHWWEMCSGSIAWISMVVCVVWDLLLLLWWTNN